MGCLSRRSFVETELEERLVSIPVTLLRGIPERIAVAGGNYKVTAIRGALLSGLITTVVTDTLTVKMLLKG